MSARSDDLQASNRLSVSSSLKLTCIFLNRSPARASYVASADRPASPSSRLSSASPALSSSLSSLTTRITFTRDAAPGRSLVFSAGFGAGVGVGVGVGFVDQSPFDADDAAE
jgi:hypothetical protein